MMLLVGYGLTGIPFVVARRAPHGDAFASAKGATLPRREGNPAFGGAKRPFGCVAGLARYAASRGAPLLPEGPLGPIKPCPTNNIML